MISRIRMREKIFRTVKERSDISNDAKGYWKERLRSAYVDLARWYLVRGEARLARRVCHEASRAGMTWALGATWLYSLAGKGLLQWLQKRKRKVIERVDVMSKRG